MGRALAKMGAMGNGGAVAEQQMPHHVGNYHE